MDKNQVLILSFWNPTSHQPKHGIFIEEQAAAICDLQKNVVFLQVNVLPSNLLLLKKTVEESAFHNNRRIVINLYSCLWKLLYVNPWYLSGVIYRILRKADIKINPVIIHTNVIFPCGIVGYLLSRRLGGKLVISEHWSKAEIFLKNPLYKRIAIKVYHQNFAIICVSEFLSRKIAKATHHKNLVVIPNVINTDIFTFLPKPPVTDGRLNFMCVAAWRTPKRLDIIIDTLLHYAPETTRQILLRVVGTGTQVDLLKTRETPENLKIEWLGHLDKPDIASLLQTTQVFLHASNIETFSIVTAEALSTGTPVLASNVGALPELINRQNGILVENNRESWLQGIREITAKQYDYQAIAIQHQNRYSPSTVGNNILKIYREAIGDMN
jgi:glycosyltransferase involved in cell wall biosynthesis